MTADPDQLKHGAALAQEGRFGEARAVFSDIIESDPNNVEALFMRGACCFKEGRHTEAGEDWNRVLSIDPQHAKARGMLAKLPASGFDSGFGAPTASSPPPVPQASAGPKPAEKTPPKRSKPKKPILKYVVTLAVVGVLGAFGADMYLNPASYPFLPKKEASPAEAPSDAGAESQAQGAGPRQTSLEEGLSGKWFFLFEGSPATFNFYPNGSLGVVINREGGVTFTLNGTYTIEGDTIRFDVETPEGPAQVTAYNARIEGPNFTFNYDGPDGPEIRAERR